MPWTGRKSVSRVRLSRSTATARLVDVGAAHAVVAREQGGRPDVVALAVRRDRQLGDRRGVAQAEIESLRADRRDHVRGLADQRDAVRAEACVPSRCSSGKAPRSGSTAILPRIECERRSTLRRERLGVERQQVRGRRRVDHADQARPQAGQRHQGERAGLGVELGRDVVVRAGMAQIEAPARSADRRGGRSRCRRRRGRASCGRRRRPPAARAGARRRQARW